jgi:transcriptional regulator of acetoin/glycerol metabolism
LVASWHQRVREFGLREEQRPEFPGLGAAKLRRILDQNRVLYSHALPVMETLQEQIQNTHTMVILTDQTGFILHSIGDEDFLAQANGVALRSGVCWSERFMGTNAIGTALTDKMATVVHGDEHFLLANRILTCSCAPILDPHGRVIGSLDVSGPQASYHPHTMALVRMSTQMIENKLFTQTFEQCLRLHFHSRPEFVGTLVEGIAAFSEDGHLVALNPSAQFQLNLAGAGMRRQTLASMFGWTVPQLFDAQRTAPLGRLMLTLHNGAKVFARADWRQLGVQPVQPASQPRSSLNSRCTIKLSDLASDDPTISRTISKLTKVLQHNFPVTILGETGTGKELWARAIHNDSPRREKPFVAVDCASIPESLIEAELFGYEGGAFTGARKRGAVGKIALSSEGSLFFDEIGDMPLALQTRLLRVLQEQEVMPLGSAKPIRVNLHVIAATHRDLRGLIAAGQFRQDLYYRLNGVTIRLPALRERTDLQQLISVILAEDNPRLKIPAVSPLLLEAFARYSWPGNIRQLASVLRTARLMAQDDDFIHPHHLQEDALEEIGRFLHTTDPGRAEDAEPLSKPRAGRLDEVRDSAISATLERYRGNVSAAARALGVSRNTIYRNLRNARRR